MFQDKVRLSALPRQRVSAEELQRRWLSKEAHRLAVRIEDINVSLADHETRIAELEAMFSSPDLFDQAGSDCRLRRGIPCAQRGGAVPLGGVGEVVFGGGEHRQPANGTERRLDPCSLLCWGEAPNEAAIIGLVFTEARPR